MSILNNILSFDNLEESGVSIDALIRKYFLAITDKSVFLKELDLFLTTEPDTFAYCLNAGILQLQFSNLDLQSEPDLHLLVRRNDSQLSIQQLNYFILMRILEKLRDKLQQVDAP